MHLRKRDIRISKEDVDLRARLKDNSIYVNLTRAVVYEALIFSFAVFGVRGCSDIKRTVDSGLTRDQIEACAYENGSCYYFSCFHGRQIGYWKYYKH